MASDRLIETLSADLRPVRRRRASRDAVTLATIGLCELALMVALGGLRPDIQAALAMPSFWWKLASMGLLAAIAIGTALRSFDPTMSPRPGLRRIAATLVVVLAIGWLLDGMAPTHHQSLATRLMWRHGLDCVRAMVVLSLPMIVGLGVLMRRNAPTDRRGTALAAGIAGAAWGQFLFAFACPSDDPLYIATWYLVGCGFVALVSRLLLQTITRW